MYIVLSQKKDFHSNYKDELFSLYHFPSSYRSRINTGDVFIYNQGAQGASIDKGFRYYFGTGVIGNIYTTDDGKSYFAELKHCKSFYNNVPIKYDDQYIEQLGYEGKRKKTELAKLHSSHFKRIV